MLKIGIDPGVKCGYAAKENGRIVEAETLTIWELFEKLDSIVVPFHVTVEDARKMSRPDLRGNHARDQGAGWVRILSGQIEAFLIKKEIPYKMIAPMRMYKKMDAASVKGMTHWVGTTNQHERDAIMIAWTA